MKTCHVNRSQLVSLTRGPAHRIPCDPFIGATLAPFSFKTSIVSNSRVCAWAISASRPSAECLLLPQLLGGIVNRKIHLFSVFEGNSISYVFTKS
ncbi:hypothetical protein IEQ34_019864 [Dendrobium chrysotoxum]|uniref:Uncharacterized protein n=1 Tax=Dendrobium chrysotoxum TaxID=161865 RepID=A0AAV7FSE8_DENCH|nr:hypothetical protein IEQ34_019864 [Dendrobium chrysotoxum]